MTVRKRGEHWHFDFQIDGVRYREAIPEARNKSEAREQEAKKRAEVLEGRFEKRKKPPTFAEFVKTYSEWAKTNKRSWRSDETHIIALSETFGKLRLDQITPFAVERFKRERLTTDTKRGTTRSKATVNRELQTLSRILTLAQDAGHYHDKCCAAS